MLSRQFGIQLDQRVRTLRCSAINATSDAFCGNNLQLLAAAGYPGPAGIRAPRNQSEMLRKYGSELFGPRGIGAYTKKEENREHVGFSAWTGGGAIGLDVGISDRALVGIMLGGSMSDVKFRDVTGDGDVDNFTVGAYVAYYGNRWFANAGFVYGKNWIHSKRNLVFGPVNRVATGDTTGEYYGAHARFGYGWNLSGTTLELSGGLDYAHQTQKAFSESGRRGVQPQHELAHR